jgi:quinohemoprotein ethanol dehydrogenase
MYTFALGGKAQPPAFVKYETEGLLEGVPYDPKDDGTALYVAACATCHGVPGVDKGLLQLGRAPAETSPNPYR